MDYRALHLQPLAHTAVKQALCDGRLVRQPCEECRAVAQAHHDSYHPDRWLTVRWLCPAHHRAWHVANEPEWPTFYYYHPSDSHDGRYRTGRAGRPPSPWFRPSRGSWYVTVDGKRHNLGKDRDAALARFQTLIGQL